MTLSVEEKELLATQSVSIIILTRERPDVLRRCLQCVYSQDYPQFEVIIVDNSPDDRSEKVVADFPDVIYLRADSGTDNVSKLRNIAIGVTSGDIIAFIDDDTLVHPGWLTALVEGFADARVGGVTGRVIEHTIPEQNTSLIGRLSPGGEILGTFNNHYPNIIDVDYMPGCNMSVRRAVVKEIGGFDPLMHFSRDDQEYSLRVRSAGYHLIFVPGVLVAHLLAPRASKTVQRSGDDPRSRFVSCRSLIYVFVRYHGLRYEFAKLAFWRLPKASIARFLHQPSLTTALYVFSSLTGIVLGYGYGLLGLAGIHRVPFPIGETR